MVLEGKSTVVTGAGSGIGKATAIMAAQEGASVVCLDLRKAEDTAAEISANGGSAVGVTGDVRDLTFWQDAIAAANAFSPIYLLVNVAGIHNPGSIVTQTEEDWHLVLDVCLKGVFLSMKAALPTMIEQRTGRIVNVASNAGSVGMKNLAAYSAAKAGVMGLTRQAAIEYADMGIRVNAIAPGITDTPILADNTPEMTKTFLAATPVGRLGRPEEQAAAIMYLASPLADFVTGQVVDVDGGWGVW